MSEVDTKTFDREALFTEAVATFSAEYKRAVEMAIDPTLLKWGIFSTGNPETEQTILDLIVKNMLKTIEGVYVMNINDDVKAEKLLRLAADNYAGKIRTKLTQAAAEDGFKLTFGVI